MTIILLEMFPLTSEVTQTSQQMSWIGLSDTTFDENALKPGFGAGTEKTGFCLADTGATYEIYFFNQQRQGPALKTLKLVNRCFHSA